MKNLLLLHLHLAYPRALHCLFLLFVNDLVCATKNSIINIYADDTLIYVSDENVITATSKLQEDINNVAQWFHKNKLSISIEKNIYYVCW